MGHSLDDVPHRLGWDDLHAVLQVSAQTVGSPLDRALRGAESQWGTTEMLLHRLEYGVRVISWQLGGDESVDPPEPIPIDPDEVIDDGAIDIDEYVALYG